MGLLKAKKVNKKLWTLEHPYAPEFVKLEAALGWPDPKGQDDLSKYGLVVGGETTTGDIVVIEECLGDLTRVLNITTAAKDRFLFDYVWIDGSDPELTFLVNSHDGLSHYKHHGYDDFEHPLWDKPGSHWPYFMDRETIAYIAKVPDEIRTSAQASAARITTLASNKKLITRTNCPKTEAILRNPSVEESAKHPLFKALSWLTWRLTSQDTPTNTTKTDAHPWYGSGVWVKGK
jgi:hypothetical protein